MAALKVLITGATGFVGSHVAESLARQRVPFRALVRPTSDTRRLEPLGAELVRGTVEDPDAVRAAVAGVDVVVHLAALTHARSTAEYFRVNERGTREILRAALETEPRPRRFVYLSSLAAAGPSENGRPIGPEDEPRPLTTYGRSKLAGEAACREAEKQLEVTILRAPAVYGPRDRELLRFFRLAAVGVLPVPAGPARRLQLVHVEDLADAVARAATLDAAAGLFHIAEPVVYEWAEVTRLVAEAVGRKARTFPVPESVLAGAAILSEAACRLTGRSSLFNREKVRELLAPGWLCETESARRVLGFEAKIPLPRGLKQTAAWYRDEGWL